MDCDAAEFDCSNCGDPECEGWCDDCEGYHCEVDCTCDDWLDE